MLAPFALAILSLAVLPTGNDMALSAYSLFDSVEHDFGKVERGTKMTHRFVLQNRTGDEVRIRRVRVSCSCTKASADSRKIAPGQVGYVDTLMDTSGFLGEKAVTIFVDFDKPQRQEVQLRVTTVSLGHLSAATNEVDFGIMAEGVPAEKRMHLDYAGNPAFVITSINYGSPHMKATVREVGRDTSKVRYELHVALAPTAPAGLFEDGIQLQTNDAKLPLIRVVAKAKIESKISVSPEIVRISDLTPGAKITRNVLIRSSVPFKVLRVDNTEGLFEVRSSPELKATQLAVLTLTVPADPSQIPQHIDFVTSLEGEQQVTLGIQH